MELEDRINQLPLKEAYVTLKDHKNNFRSNPKCRLINPTKSELGRISKQILERINKELRSRNRHMQWTSSEQVIEWYSGLEKFKYKFIKFDIVEFYPSISEELLDKAIKFSRQYIEVNEEEIKIVKHAAKSVLFSDGVVYKKNRKNEERLFDITMGRYHGAEVYELVGLYSIHARQFK